MQSYKIDVRNMTEQQKKDVQSAFFMLGYKWRGSEATYKHLDKPFYFAEFEAILYCECAEYFFNDKDCEDNKVITYKELMTLAYGDNMMNTQKAAFTKSELKDGMVVKLRGGTSNADKYGGLMLVVGQSLQQATEYDRLDKYLDNLKSKSYAVLDIVEVFEVGDTGRNSLSQIQDWVLKSIWKRPEQTQQQKQLAELKAAQEQLLLKAKEIADKIDALQGKLI